MKGWNMRKVLPVVLVAIFVLAVLRTAGDSGEGQQAPAQGQTIVPGPLPGTNPPAAPLHKLEDAFLRWPLPKGLEAYGAIDGKHLHGYVTHLAGISRRYRDRGHPQFWGRITGTESDTETAQWLVTRFKEIGLTDVHIKPHDLVPQWMAQSWAVTATGGGKVLPLVSAQPAYLTPATGAEGVDLEAVWVGTGSEADFAGRDVRGKAAFYFSMPLPGMRRTGSSEGVAVRAESKGAAAIFEVVALPGNLKYQAYPARTKVPTFLVGWEDGYALRELIGQAPAGQPARVRTRLDVTMVPNLKTGTVWATLPGATDETIYVVAHYDGWFDAATDNASGVATQLGLAEYFAKVPRAQRRRTIIFLGFSGHHNAANKSVEWLMAHKEVFAKTALVIESEHTSTLQTYFYGPVIRRANTYTAQIWYAGGPSRPKLQAIAVSAFRDFGVSTYAEPERTAPPTDLSMMDFWRYVPAVSSNDYNMYFHTDGETPETVPWTGLEATTRAYAKIIDEVNKLELNDLQRPPELPTTTTSK